MNKAQTQIVELREITISKNAVVDRERCVIRGVRILGPSSLNGRFYTQEAIRKAAGMYESVMVNVDHPQMNVQERTVADRLGWLESVSYKGGGLSGDLYFLRSDPRADKICEAAERKPELFGLSHNVKGRTRRDGETTVVEEITQVISVDVVSDPASTKSLFESQGKVLMEDELVPVATNATTPDPGEAIKWGFRDAVIGVLDSDGDKKAKLAKIKALLDAEDKAMTTLAGKADDSSETPADGEGKTEESRKDKSDELAVLREENRRLKAEAEVRELIEAAGARQEPVLIKALMGLPNKADREELIESWPKSGPTRPRSLMPKRATENKESPQDAESFAQALVG